MDLNTLKMEKGKQDESKIRFIHRLYSNSLVFKIG